MRPGAARVLTLGAAALVAWGASGCGDAERFPDDDPRTAVGRLLLATVGQANGARACALLTQREQRRLDEGPAGSCRGALGKVAAVLPGQTDEPSASDRTISKLDFTTRVAGERAVVRVTGRGLDLRFTLVRDDFVAPRATDPGVPWRVDGGIEQLLRG
ncbi:hypothetical protein SK069_13475 [Patulibacter brassicae]|uniref:Lipoprotein n=1 Tax=Patulibacter brassicae TaxID=1705717 RepID=A0ABU4VMD3_9ACTN|nr:hypothetical protein [Patulibacter brassicae]MDX8152610.1 hypothetical protein [Patulibacter brassicae]